jgi:hypothetical protein
LPRNPDLPRRHGVRLVAVAAIVCAVAGCGGSGAEPAGLSTETVRSPVPTTGPATTSAVASGAATGTATAAVSNLPPGLVFEDIPQASGKAAAALQAYLGLEKEIWRSFLAAELSPDLPKYAMAPVIADWEASIKYQQDHDLVGGGRIVISPTIERVSDHLVLIGGCADMSELTNIVDGEEAPPQEVLESPTWVIEAIVMVDQATGGGWKVSEYRQEPGTC